MYSEIEPGRITILSPRSAEQCCAAQITAIPLDVVEQDNVEAVVTASSKNTTFSTISTFKGLENDYIILTDVDRLDTDWWRAMIYVGMSRARTGLSMLLPETLRLTYQQRLQNWIKKHEQVRVE